MNLDSRKRQMNTFPPPLADAQNPPPDAGEKKTLVEQIAAAVLYEGYILYPYGPSIKNHQRWTFGGVYPRSYSETQGTNDPWRIQTECLLLGDPIATLDV